MSFHMFTHLIDITTGVCCGRSMGTYRTIGDLRYVRCSICKSKAVHDGGGIRAVLPRGRPKGSRGRTGAQSAAGSRRMGGGVVRWVHQDRN
jgi:hypothetical protein